MFNRLSLRIALRRSNDPHAKEVLEDHEKFDELLGHLEAQHSSEKGGKLQDFFTWLMANLPAIIAMIKVLFPK